MQPSLAAMKPEVAQRVALVLTLWPSLEQPEGLLAAVHAGDALKEVKQRLHAPTISELRGPAPLDAEDSWNRTSRHTRPFAARRVEPTPSAPSTQVGHALRILRAAPESPVSAGSADL